MDMNLTKLEQIGKKLPLVTGATTYTSGEGQDPADRNPGTASAGFLANDGVQANRLNPRLERRGRVRLRPSLVD